MARKSFKDPALNFISAAEEQETKPRDIDPEGAQIPKGYRLVRESKNQRTQILLRPTTKQTLRDMAEEQGKSLNELINSILEDYIDGKGDK